MSKSSPRWLHEHHSDTYVKQALQSGYRSRAVYKLAQIDERDKLLRPGMTIVDLGAAPGGWSQWVTQRLSRQVQVIAVDLLAMQPLPNVTFIQGDFCEATTVDKLLELLGNHKADLVMSDMSPNITGIKEVDQTRSLLLAELAQNLALQVLAKQGHFLTKVFQGSGFDGYMQSLRPHFRQVVIRKPDASRARSAEIYVLAKQYQV